MTWFLACRKLALYILYVLCHSSTGLDSPWIIQLLAYYNLRSGSVYKYRGLFTHEKNPNPYGDNFGLVRVFLRVTNGWQNKKNQIWFHISGQWLKNVREYNYVITGCQVWQDIGNTCIIVPCMQVHLGFQAAHLSEYPLEIHAISTARATIHYSAEYATLIETA